MRRSWVILSLLVASSEFACSGKVDDSGSSVRRSHHPRLLGLPGSKGRRGSAGRIIGTRDINATIERRSGPQRYVDWRSHYTWRNR